MIPSALRSLAAFTTLWSLAAGLTSFPAAFQRALQTPSAPPARSSATEARAQSAPRRIALLVGIADYKNFEADGPPGESDLRGPRTDVARMQHSLARFGFDDSLVTVLVDSQASRAALRSALIGLADKVHSPDDVVVFYYSGHGTQVADENGDEDDGVDEALVPWDVKNIRDAHQVIIDDSLGIWLGALQTKNVTVIVDACFSGTITRSLGGEIARGAPPLPRPARAAAPAPAPAEAAPDAIGAERAMLREVPFTVITAAAANELAVELPWADLDNRYAGVFTYNLTRLLDEAAGSTIRYDAFMGVLRDEVRKWTRQTPQLEGTAQARASRLFNVSRDSLPPPSALVARRSDGRWSLSIGAMHGVRRGTTFDVASGDAGAARTIGQFLVDSVGDAEARLAPIGTPAGDGALARGVATISTMPPNARSVDMLRVWLSPRLRGLTDAISALPFIALTSDSLTADVSVMPDESGVAVRVADANITPLPKWRYPRSDAFAPWVSDSADVVSPARPGDRFRYARTPNALCTALRRAWVASGIRSVANPVRNYNLTVDVRVARAGATPPAATALTVDTLVEGETYDLLVRAVSYTSAPIFLSVAVAGQRGIPLTTLLPESNPRTPAASDSVNLRVNGGWSRIRFGRATAPFGSDFVTAYVGAFPYSFSQLVAQTPTCTRTSTRSLERDPAVTGWTSATRRIVFVPRDRGAR